MMAEMTIQERIDDIRQWTHLLNNPCSAYHLDIIEAHIKKQDETIAGLESYHTEAIERIRELEEQLQIHIDLRDNSTEANDG